MTAWSRRDTLALSGPADRDFCVDVDENDQATLRFGDAVNGAVPESGAALTVTYRTGGGVAGNVSANSVTTIADAAALRDIGATVTYGILGLDVRYVATDSDVYGKDKIVGSAIFSF